MGRTYKKKFTSKNRGVKNLQLPHGSVPGTPQSMALIDYNNVVVIHNQGNANSTAHIRLYNRTQGFVKNSDTLTHNLGHCNGATYCSKDKRIYCTGYNGSSNVGKIVVFNLNFKQVYSFTLPHAASGIAYDPLTDQFYTTSGTAAYVHSYKSFSANAGSRGAKKTFSVMGGRGQDCGGYGGRLYRVLWHENYGDIDVYDTSRGSYLGSIKIGYSETESCAVAPNGAFVYLTANQCRQLHWTEYSPINDFGVAKGTKAPEVVDRKKYINKYGNEARVYFQLIDLGYSHKGACAIMGNIAQESNFNTTVISGDGYGSQGLCQWTGPRLTNLKNFCKGKSYKWNSVEGQIRFLDHELKSYKSLRKKLINGTGSLASLVDEFCFTFERPARSAANIPNRTNKANLYFKRYKGLDIPGGLALDGGAYETDVGVGLRVSPEMLISSDNYSYITNPNAIEKVKITLDWDAMAKTALGEAAGVVESISNLIKSLTGNKNGDISSVTTKVDLDKKAADLKNTSRKSGTVATTSLLSYPSLVEAPYVELTLGGQRLGTYQVSGNKYTYPNFISSLDIKKTNGTLNTYAIRLINQIQAGADPNFIDKLLSKNGYNKIKLAYGDSTNASLFKEDEALITGVKTSFDFTGCKIIYTIYATSNMGDASGLRLTYAQKKSKPSDIIKDMLYKDSTKALLRQFPGMKNRALVESKGLIASDDKEIEIGTLTNIDPISYITTLVSNMTSINNAKDAKFNDSTYYFTVHDDVNNEFGGAYFKVTKVTANTKPAAVGNMYEVDVGFPQNDFVLDFKVNTDSSWLLSYEFGSNKTSINESSTITDKAYNIDNQGNVTYTLSDEVFNSSKFNKTVTSDKNWWTQVTQFPISATLTIKGLMKPMMLMSYIKVNSLYYGQRRNTSGLYVVTQQEDKLDSTGYKTVLSLLRVAGDNEYLNTNAVVTKW